MNSILEREPVLPVTTPRWLALLALLALLASFHSPEQAAAQSAIELSSVVSTTHGVRMSWSPSEPGQVFTIQTRNSLTEGAWKDAATRYRWPWARTNWTDVPVNLPSTRFYRVVAHTATIADRGRLLTNTFRAQTSTNSLKTIFASWGVAEFVNPRFGTTERRFTYETIDPYGLPVMASGLLILPRVTNGPLPLISMQHGTMPLISDAPSRSSRSHEYVWGIALASHGYAVVMPDYLGLGSSPGYQAYLHAKSEATCVVDALRAGRSLCASNNVPLNGQIFLTGYSQGGHVTMAAHQELETFHADEFSVAASAPCAGPYDLGGVTIDGILASPAYPGGPFFAIMLASYLPIYALGDSLEEMLDAPFRLALPQRLDGNNDLSRIAEVLPADPVAILRPDFQADFRTNADNPLRRALAQNNLHSWTPKAPTRMFHCQADEIVPFANAEIAYQSFTNRGACCVSVADPGAPATLDHEGCIFPSLREVLAWFETLRR